ncbi:MAG: ABC transporter substrate-binding protein [Hyphomicrobiaceae bacterium]
MSRRQLIISALATGATLPLAMSLADKALAATPKRGGRFRIGSAGGATTDSLDPTTHTNQMVTLHSFCVANRLAEVTAEGRLAGELAESIEPSVDAKSWRFKLRKGIEFHNGKSLTPEDVVVSVRHHMGEDTKSAMKSSLKIVESIEVDGSDAVIFKLTTGSADFPYVTTDYHLPILPSEGGKLDWQSGIGTGPYAMDAFDPGVRGFYRRNPNYWRSDAAFFDEIEVLSILDATARNNALVSGSVDAIDQVEAKTTQLLRGVAEARIIEVTGRVHHAWPMRVEAAPFNNVDFRLAVKHALDRNEILKKVHLGLGIVGNDTPISPAYEFYADLPQRVQDIDKARYHLEKSGVGQGVTIPLHTSDGAYSGAVDSALLIKSQLAKVGINVNVISEPKDGYWSNVWRKAPWCAVFWYGRPTIDWMMTSAYAADSSYNDAGWQHERFNKLLAEARAELDSTKRAGMYRELQSIVRDEAATAVTTFANFVMAARTNVGMPDKLISTYPMDGGKAVERWWFN